MLVCHCLAVNDSEIKAAVRNGAATVDDVIDLTDAGALCGGCHPNICKLLESHSPEACGGDICMAGGNTVASKDHVPQAGGIEARRCLRRNSLREART